MADQPSSAPERVKSRGTPPGKGVLVMPHGGRIGMPPFVKTPEQAARARQLAKAFPPAGERHIARLMGIGYQTLRRHFADDLELGRAEMLAAVGAQMVNRAIDANATDSEGKPIVKGDLDAQKFILARLGGWSTKVEHSGAGGGPIRTFDLSNLSDDQKDALLPIIDQLLAATGEVVDAEFSEVPDGGEPS
jgi:hypothetical protein